MGTDLAAKLMVSPRTGILTVTVTTRSVSEGILKQRALFGVFTSSNLLDVELREVGDKSALRLAGQTVVYPWKVRLHLLTNNPLGDKTES